MKFNPILATVIAASLTGCGGLPTKPSPAGPSPLVIFACPEQAPLADDTMGAAADRLIALAIAYRECRSAALAGSE